MARVLPPAERRGSILVASYVAVSVLLLLVGDRLPQSALRGAGTVLFAPLDRWVLAGERLAAAWRENGELHRRLAALELESSRLRSLGAEDQRLRQQLGLPGHHDPALKPVEILALSGEPMPVAAILSAGRHQGLHLGDAVVTSDGLVGRISEVYAFSSRVALLTDPNAPVACEVESTGVLGIVRCMPALEPTLMLTTVPFADTVRVGERVWTSGLSRRYPRGIPVGRVIRVGADPNGLTQAIVLAPAARLSRLRHVFVIPGPAPLEATP